MHQTIFKVRMHSLLDSKATQQTHKRTNSLYWCSIHRTVQIGNSAVRLYMAHLLDISKPINKQSIYSQLVSIWISTLQTQVALNRQTSSTVVVRTSHILSILEYFRPQT